jgi:riboflavin kinase
VRVYASGFLPLHLFATSYFSLSATPLLFRLFITVFLHCSYSTTVLIFFFPVMDKMKPWFLRGKVIHGFGRGGTQLGYPTANIELTDEAIQFLRPYDNQVLWGWGCIEAASAQQHADESLRTAAPTQLGPFPFAMSIGNNPQFKNKAISAEVYFLHNFHADFYDCVVRIITLERIRVQSAFTTLDELIKMIDSDIAFTSQHRKLEQWVAYEHHKMVQPTASPTDVGLHESVPAFGFLDV